jgi:hypothetical protein
MLTLHNQFGQLDLSVIDPAEVAKLGDEQQSILSLLISSVQDREAAQVRFNKAVISVREATTEQESPGRRRMKSIATCSRRKRLASWSGYLRGFPLSSRRKSQPDLRWTSPLLRGLARLRRWLTRRCARRLLAGLSDHHGASD